MSMWKKFKSVDDSVRTLIEEGEIEETKREVRKVNTGYLVLAKCDIICALVPGDM